MTATLDGLPTAVAAGELHTVALAGGAAPAGLGGRYRRIVDGSIDDRGGLALSVELAGSAATGAVLLVAGGAAGGGTGAGGEVEVVALTGDAAPGGGRFRAFRELDLADGGQVLFRAELDGCPATEGLFLRTPDGIREVARAGNGGTPAYASFAQPTLVDAGGVPSLAFVARLAGGRECVSLHPSFQQPALALYSGSPLGEEVVEGNLTISRLGMGLCCVARVRRGGRLATTALVLTASVVASGDGLRTGAVLAGYGRVARLLTPPAVCAQLGFVTVGLDDGRMALCSRPPVLAEPSVVLAAGEQLPGLEGEPVHRIGTPVASSSAALQLPFGVGCVVRLRTGRAALWVGVFGGQQPLQGAAIVPWLDGERTADHPERPVSRLSPVKLGNDGTLLMRAVLGEAGERRTSLLALPGLFDWYGARP